MTEDEIKSRLDSVRETERLYRLAMDKTAAYRHLLMYGKDIMTAFTDRRGLDGYEAEADRLFDELMSLRRSAEDIILSAGDAVLREVLTRRYIIGQKWEDIAEVMHYDLRWIYCLHKKALSVLAKNSL